MYEIAINLTNFLLIFFNIITFAIFIRVILSWLPGLLGGLPLSLAYVITDPFIAPIRNLIEKSPINTGMFDFSPMLTILIIRFISTLLISIL